MEHEILASFGKSASSAESSGVNLYTLLLTLSKLRGLLCVSVPFIGG